MKSSLGSSLVLCPAMLPLTYQSWIQIPTEVRIAAAILVPVNLDLVRGARSSFLLEDPQDGTRT